jgi:hypothetical protein
MMKTTKILMKVGKTKECDITVMIRLKERNTIIMILMMIMMTWRKRKRRI